jgi:hypothetical protein
MIDMPPSVAEQLRLALLSDLRTVAETLNGISDRVDAELASPSPNLRHLQTRFLELAATLEIRKRLHERIGWPGEPITAATLTLSNWDEKNLALEILAHYHQRLTTQLADANASERPPLIQGLRLLTDFLQVATIEPESTIHLRRLNGGQR